MATNKLLTLAFTAGISIAKLLPAGLYGAGTDKVVVLGSSANEMTAYRFSPGSKHGVADLSLPSGKVITVLMAKNAKEFKKMLTPAVTSIEAIEESGLISITNIDFLAILASVIRSEKGDWLDRVKRDRITPEELCHFVRMFNDSLIILSSNSLESQDQDIMNIAKSFAEDDYFVKSLLRNRESLIPQPVSLTPLEIDLTEYDSSSSSSSNDSLINSLSNKGKKKKKVVKSKRNAIVYNRLRRRPLPSLTDGVSSPKGGGTTETPGT